jgi:carboxyl-terminal processing protease
MRLDSAVQLIRGKKGTTVKLMIKKPDGDMQHIAILRDKVVIEETYARSAVLKDKNSGEKVGYLNLPKFYADFQEASGRRCAPDVKAELIKLNKEGVNSLIFDLRNNSGGSLSDVVEMFGYFISSGPVVQVKDNQGKINVLEDKDKSIVFNKPLIVLINEGSASASEIFAAAAQDYQRGVIMGSPSSYGKGTVQQFLDFDQMLNSAYNQYKPLGALKITIQKFYRISGASTQLKGVSSDVVLPDPYEYIPVGERESDHAMPWDEIKNSNYTVWNSDLMKKAEKSSEKRIAKDTLFSLIEDNAKRMKSLKDESLFPLNFQEYTDLMTKRENEFKKYKVLSSAKSALNFSPLSDDLSRLKSDTTQTKILQQWVGSLQNDYYLDEVYRVAKDLK